MRLVLAFLLTLMLAYPVQAGTWTANDFIYKPSLGARGEIEKNKFDSGMNLVDARLGKEIFVGDPNYGPTLQDALTNIGANQCILVVSPGTHTISTNTTIGDNVTIKVVHGATLSISTSVTLTIKGDIIAGRYQVFSWSGTGKLALTDNYKVRVLYPEWWGAKGDSSTDNTNAIKAAIDCANTTPTGEIPIQFGPGTYVISSPITLKTHLHGMGPHSTRIKAASGFSGSMLVDLYESSLREGLDIKGIRFSSNWQSGVSCLGSSNDGCGNSFGTIEGCFFDTCSGTYAVKLHTTGAPCAGGLTGRTFKDCKWAGNDGDIYVGNNQDDVTFINCRFICQNNQSAGTPIRISGINCSFKGCFIFFENLFNNFGVRAPVQVDAYNFKMDNCFFETNGSDVTHLFYFGGVNINYELSNLFCRVDESNASPNLKALFRTNVSAWTSTRYPYVKVHNVVPDRNSISVNWNLAELYVGAESPSVNDRLYLEVTGCDFFQWPLFTWVSGSYTKTHETMIIHGTHRGKRLAHGFKQTDNSNFYSEWGLENTSRSGGKAGIVQGEHNGWYNYGPSPATATYTLPGEGIWLVTVITRADQSIDESAQGTWVVYYTDETNDILATDQIGSSKFSSDASYGLDSLTLSAPTATGVVTATFGWTDGQPHACDFIFKAKRLAKASFFGE